MRKPLEHIRILEIAQVWAGPYATQMLSVMGAEVIHLESHNRPDMARQFNIVETEVGNFEDRSPYFVQHNRGKLGMSLNLADPRGREIFLKLVPHVDAILNNYSRRVMPNWGFTLDKLSELNPQIVLVGMPSYGGTGPMKDYVCFGEALESATGLVRPRGYRPEEPLRSGSAYPDPAGGLAAAAALLMGLAYRRRTGKGVSIDLSQRDVSVKLMGEAFLAYQMNGEEPSQLENRHPHWAPHRAFRAKGDDRWLTIAVRTDEEWRRLCDVMGRPELADDPRFASGVARLRSLDELNAAVEAWTATQDAHAAQMCLMRAGVPAAQVLSPGEGLSNEQFLAREFHPTIDHPVIGKLQLFSMPHVFHRLKTRLPTRSPLFGEHTRELLHRLAGIDDAEYDRLEAEGIVGGHPVIASARV